jgi:hypothetical membrane protein
MARPVPLTQALLACGAICGPLFVAVFLVEGALRPGYSALRHPVSALAIGPSGWVQDANFVVTGTLVVAFAVGLRGTGVWAPLLIGVTGIGFLGAGFFTCDPLSGYPAGTPAVPIPTLHGTVHNSVSGLVFTALPAACLVMAVRCARRGRRGWAGYSVATAVVFLACFVLAAVAFAQQPALVAVGGLLQRLTLVSGFAWLTALALHLRAADRTRSSTQV